MNKASLKLALQNPNVYAFQHAIRLGEGTPGDIGYYTIVGGQTFSDDSHHPNVRVWLPKYKVWSTAAGAYQIIFRTWVNLLRQYDFDDFSPESQDMAAVALIYGRGALDDVMAGNLKEAVRKCSAEWASLPGSTAGQRMESFEAVQNEYLNHGGKLA